jgi:hypothetical protein
MFIEHISFFVDASGIAQPLVLKANMFDYQCASLI